MSSFSTLSSQVDRWSPWLEHSSELRSNDAVLWYPATGLAQVNTEVSVLGRFFDGEAWVDGVLYAWGNVSELSGLDFDGATGGLANAGTGCWKAPVAELAAAGIL